MDHGKIRALAGAQYGLVTRQQVLELGASDKKIRRLISSGQWDRTSSGIYVVGAEGPSWERRAMTALLLCGPDAMLSGFSAARAWGLISNNRQIEILVNGQRRVRVPGAKIKRSSVVEPSDQAKTRGLRVTSLSRTLIELSPRRTPDEIGELLDTAIREYRLNTARVEKRAKELILPGRSSTASLLTALAERGPGYDAGRSTFESRILNALSKAEVPPPVRQHPVRRLDGEMAFLDIAYPDEKVSVEADSWKFHSSKASFDADRIRHNELVLLGWDVLHVTWVMSDTQIVRTIAHAIGWSGL